MHKKDAKKPLIFSKNFHLLWQDFFRIDIMALDRSLSIFRHHMNKNEKKGEDQ